MYLNRRILFIVGFILVVSSGLGLLGLNRLTIIGISFLAILGYTYFFDTEEEKDSDDR